jgi:hypothetical protein
MNKLGFRWVALSLTCLSLTGACGEDASPSDSGNPPTTCEPQTFTVRSLAGFAQCCEGEGPSPLGDGLATCDAPGPGGSGGETSLGSAGPGGTAGDAAALGGSSGDSESAWVILTHPFESEWEGGSDVCLHLTSTGAQISGDAALYFGTAQSVCSAPASSKVTRFIATESATAYVCLNTNGPALESPGNGATLSVAFRFREGGPESLRIDAMDVTQDACQE